MYCTKGSNAWYPKSLKDTSNKESKTYFPSSLTGSPFWYRNIAIPTGVWYLNGRSPSCKTTISTPPSKSHRFYRNQNLTSSSDNWFVREKKEKPSTKFNNASIYTFHCVTANTSKRHQYAFHPQVQRGDLLSCQKRSNGRFIFPLFPTLEKERKHRRLTCIRKGRRKQIPKRLANYWLSKLKIPKRLAKYQLSKLLTNEFTSTAKLRPWLNNSELKRNGC